MTKDEALKLALEALISITDAIYVNSKQEADAVYKANDAITAIKEALAQPDQEPVGEVVNATDKAFECRFVKILPIGTKFYTAPPQRTWVGLTDDEREELMDTYDVASTDYVHAIEAKLKEKNT